MAEAFLKDSKMKLEFDIGMDENGKVILKSKTFSNIKKSSTPTQIRQAADALASLSNDLLAAVERNDAFDITQ